MSDIEMTKDVTTHVDPEVHRALNVLASMRGTTIKALVDVALRRYLKAQRDLPAELEPAPNEDGED